MHRFMIIVAFLSVLNGCGKEGSTGPAGPAGPAGSAGPAGPEGEQGETLTFQGFEPPVCTPEEARRNTSPPKWFDDTLEDSLYARGWRVENRTLHNPQKDLLIEYWPYVDVGLGVGVLRFGIKRDQPTQPYNEVIDLVLRNYANWHKCVQFHVTLAEGDVKSLDPLPVANTECSLRQQEAIPNDRDYVSDMRGRINFYINSDLTSDESARVHFAGVGTYDFGTDSEPTLDLRVTLNHVEGFIDVSVIKGNLNNDLLALIVEIASSNSECRTYTGRIVPLPSNDCCIDTGPDDNRGEL